MGDARTEHLLLAARKVRAMRQSDDRVGRLTLEELKRGGVIGPEGGLGYSEGYGGMDDIEDDADESDLEEKPILSERRVKGKGKMATPGPKKGMKPPSTPGAQKTSRQPLTTPGGSNFNDLLRAAEMATRPTTPSPGSQAVSATRTTNARDSQSPKKVDKGEEKADSDGENTALDLLLQASQIDSPEGQPSKKQKKETRLGLAPALELRQTPGPVADHLIDPTLVNPSPRTTSSTFVPPLSTPQQRPRKYSNASASAEITTPARNWYQESPFDAGSSPPLVAKRERFGSIAATPLQEGENTFNSPTGGTVPGLGKYVHLTSSMPARRMRSPYLKWTVEEVSSQ